MNTRKATASLALLLAAGFGVSACGTGAGDTAKDTVASASDAVTKNLSDADKEKLAPFIKDYLSKARTAELPSGDLPDDIKAITDKLNGAEDAKSISGIAETIDSSELSDEEKQKLDDYLKDLDPTADKFVRDDLTVGQSIGLSMINLGFGSVFSMLDESLFDSFDVDLEKTEFSDNTAKTSADSFTMSGASTSADASASTDGSSQEQMALKVVGTFFDGVTFKYADDEWKIDAPSYIENIDKQVQNNSASASATE